MSGSETMVIAGAVAAIALVNWYFWPARRPSTRQTNSRATKNTREA